MAYKLIIMKNDQMLRELPLVKPTTLIGRRQHNDLILDDPTVSGKHAAIYTGESQISIEDLGSTNGTYVNGDAIPAKQPHELGLGDRLVVGSYRISLQMQVSDAWNASSVSPTIAAGSFENTTRHALSQGPSAAIEILSGINKGRQLLLTKVVTTIGPPGQGVISLTHRLNAYYIKHLEGEQIVRINGQPLQSDNTKLNNGDRIQLAGIEMVFKLSPV
ncbi:FHA domain-containing protein [Lampropedia puyangensis]|uniref:FHA domain-containing protein n=1 Tax=Lampropedia puyangensis TaxID=1330072 RepID=A0A4S8F7W8_9BURK|nr:FHA domain-containing protein [Lampropedia puyangensis]THU03703.1 FHA domain-containing protein [Lampropedia puyangensis]